MNFLLRFLSPQGIMRFPNKVMASDRQMAPKAVEALQTSEDFRHPIEDAVHALGMVSTSGRREARPLHFGGGALLPCPFCFPIPNQSEFPMFDQISQPEAAQPYEADEDHKGTAPSFWQVMNRCTAVSPTVEPLTGKEEE